MNSYREQFFEWVNKQPLYQAMNLQAKEMALHLVDCWLNNDYAYLSNARLDGKDFAKRCAIDFCWFVRNRTISDLEHQLKVVDKALELACEPRDDWGGEKYSGTEYCNYYDYFKAKAKEMLKDE